MRSIFHAFRIFLGIRKWLEDSRSGNEENVWGFEKVAYHFSDLKEWLKEGKKGKGKQKLGKQKKTEKVSKKKSVDNSKSKKK
jgi:hypothetical protein